MANIGNKLKNRLHSDYATQIECYLKYLNENK